MNDYSVYIHTAPSGRVYVGISKNPLRRWNEGRGYKFNPYFWRCIKKYGWDNIKHEILYAGLSLEEAKEKEIELVEKYKSNIREYGYNIRDGGDCGAAKESREKMSAARLGNKNCVGRKLGDETKGKISQSLKDYYSNHEQYFKGRHHSQSTRQKLSSRPKTKEYYPLMRAVQCLSLDGKLIKTYNCIMDASRELKVDGSSISKCCRGKIAYAGGYIWRYVEQTEIV